jgi:hypothetical protein
MQALLVGGPLHGKRIDLDDAHTRAVAGADDQGVEHVYVRRSSHSQLGSEVALFVDGRPTYDQVVDAITRSDLTRTAKLRVLGTDNDPGI